MGRNKPSDRIFIWLAIIFLYWNSKKLDVAFTKNTFAIGWFNTEIRRGQKACKGNRKNTEYVYACVPSSSSLVIICGIPTTTPTSVRC